MAQQDIFFQILRFCLITTKLTLLISAIALFRLTMRAHVTAVEIHEEEILRSMPSEK